MIVARNEKMAIKAEITGHRSPIVRHVSSKHTVPVTRRGFHDCDLALLIANPKPVPQAAESADSAWKGLVHNLTLGERIPEAKDSLLILAKQESPFGLNPTCVTGHSWPINKERSRPVARSHSRTLWSSLAVATN